MTLRDVILHHRVAVLERIAREQLWPPGYRGDRAQSEPMRQRTLGGDVHTYHPFAVYLDRENRRLEPVFDSLEEARVAAWAHYDSEAGSAQTSPGPTGRSDDSG